MYIIPFAQSFKIKFYKIYTGMKTKSPEIMCILQLHIAMYICN